MRTFRKCLAILVFFTLVMNFPLAALADGLNAKEVTVLSNSFIKVTVDNNSGRFAIRTVDGQPVRKNDQQVDMMFRGDDPESSFTTFRIDGTDYIFGNPYKFLGNLNFLSEVTPPKVVNNTDGTRQIETVWTIKGVSIKQILMLYMDVKDKKNAGNVNIRYEVTNHSGVDVQVGSRILLDTMVGGNDGPAFQVGTAYNVPLQVERRLVDESKLDRTIGLNERALYTLPAYWVMKDKYDKTNPLATNVVAYGFNNFSEKDINIVDEMIVGHWNKMANTKWDYQVNPNLDFTTDTNDYGTADSAVAFYWNPKSIKKEATKSFETVYGLGEVVEPDKVFSIRYIDPVNQLATNDDASAYENEGVFNIIAEIENLPAFQMEQSQIDAELQLANGLKFVDLDERGQIQRDGNGKIKTKTSDRSAITFKKEATPEEAQNNKLPKYKPGETVTASFKVVATGKAWPTTKEYMLTVSSPETEKKLLETLKDESIKDEPSKDKPIQDESIKAQYMSSKANFVFLPAIGKGSQTFVYAMSPKEAYTTDVKYITLNLSNIEAYNTGNAITDPNFDLYLKERATGNRYKVPVKNSVILQPSGDGQVGDMRITYRTGDLVDANGAVMKDGNDLGPSLPLGEYQVEIDYKGDTGDNPDDVKLYDITTSQRFVVSENEEARVKKANLLAVVKKTVNLSNPSKEDLEEAYPGYTVPEALNASMTIFKQVKDVVKKASKLADPEMDLTSLLPEASMPAYRLVAFESEEELEQFKEEAEHTEQEVLVEIKGMINRIGKGEDVKYVVDTKSEPAIINNSVAYRGKDMVFSTGQLDIFGLGVKFGEFKNIPFLNTLNVKGDGTLSVASSGFIFHKGEWTLDFFNGFDKSLTAEDAEEPEAEADKGGEDDSLNGSLKWAAGNLGDRLNPLRQLMIHDVYFNKHSLFAAPSFSVSGFGLKFNDFILREDGVSFGGTVNMKIANAEIKNVKFNDKGFVGIDADLKFKLGKSIGLIDGDESEGEGENLASGEINIVHYEQKEAGVENTYGLQFDADLRGITKVHVEIAFKQVADKRILPNVIAFSAELGDPGVMVAGGTYLTGIRGAIRELADTIAGGSSDVPLTIEAGADITFGVKPATFYGSIDMTLRRSGIKLVGKMDYRASSTSDRLEMLKEAMVSAQWMTPWFVSASAEIDVMGWDLIIGKASIFLGQNLIKNRIDFEGFVSAKVQVPGKVPIFGGMGLGGVSLGANNDKMWGSVSILFFSLGITYYFNGGVEFGTSGEGLPEGLIYLQVQDPEKGPRLVVFGEGVQTVATSWETKEDAIHEIEYHSVAKGVEVLDNGSMNVGIGGIKVSDEGKLHEIPMSSLTGDALLELTYYGSKAPNLVMKDNNGKDYKLIYDETRTNPQANAFTQQLTTDGSKKVYIAIPHDRIGGSIWKLYSNQSVDSKLMNIPQVAKLDEIKLDPSRTDANTFTASWKASHAKPGDTVSLYLTKDAVSTTKQAFNEEIAAPGDTGLLIAKDLNVANLGGVSGSITTGQKDIDVTKVPLLGDTEDIRGLLSQGNYYLRAELKSATNFQTMTTTNKFEIIDPLAPSPVSDVSVRPAGNGYFDLSFKPAGRGKNQADSEISYAVDVLQEANGKLSAYPNFASLQMTEEELKPYWNASNGKYEHIRLGGWTANSKSSEVNPKSLAGDSAAGDLKYTGLAIGQSYVVGVSAAAKPSKLADKHQNIHYAERVDTASTLLPVPSKPKLTAQVSQLNQRSAVSSTFLDVLTNQKEQSITITSDQKNVEVEAIYDDKSLATFDLDDQSNGSSGTLHFSNFTTDGKYAIELRTRNKTTGDFSVTILYLTVDTMAPVIYIDTPLTGERTKNGKIKVSGTTSIDATLEVNGESVTVSKDGRFEGEVKAESSDPTFAIAFKAHDQAGNSNQASVTLTNGAYQVPVGLVLRKVPNLKLNGTAQVKAYLRMANGSAEVEADPSKLKFSNYLGEAISVSETGAVRAVKVGAGMAKAEYQLGDGMSLQAMTVVNVEDSIIANTSAVSNNTKATKVNILVADLTDAALVYRVYPKSDTTPTAPKFQDDVSSWTLLPDDGVIPVAEGDKIAVAKRPKGGKLNDGVTGLMSAVIWSPSGGGTGAGPGAVSPPVVPEVLVGGEKVASVRKGDRILAKIDQLSGEGKDKTKLLIQSEDKLANGYEFELSRSLLQQAANGKQPINVDLPFAQLTFPAQDTLGGTGNITVKIDRNDSSVQSSFRQIANELGADLLGDGQGVSFDLSVPSAYQARSVNAKVAVPANMNAKDITAVVVRDANGNWTTVPWKLDVVNNQPFVSLTLTGSGSVAFIGNHKNFIDVDNQNWAKQPINEAAGKLFMLGRTSEKFDPQSHITRAEYPTVLLRVLGLMNQVSATTFADVSPEDWYSRSVAIAAQQGIVDGFEDGTYKPNEELSRMEAMIMVGRSLKLIGAASKLTATEVNDTLGAFKDDASIPDWAREAVALCIKLGIITGQDQSISPTAPLTRAQAAAIAMRLSHITTIDIP